MSAACANMDPAHVFVRRLMDEILHLHRLPKVQVERIVGPILGIFLRDLLGPLLDGAPGYEVIAPEFPLKHHGSNQSTNVDWLAVHPGLGLVILVELKTAAGSFGHEQLAIYERVQQRVATEGGAFLVNELREIREGSDQRAKYDALIAACEPHEDALREARRAVTLYLTPLGTPLPGDGERRVVRHFRDLPEAIDGDLRAEWAIIRERLGALDESPRAAMSAAELARHVLANLHRQREARAPVQFWMGSTGSGEAPNYQVEFSDGSVQAYHHGGAAHRAGRFREENLHGPYVFMEAGSRSD